MKETCDKVISCIESQDGSECENARSHTDHFNEDFYSQIIGGEAPFGF